MKIKKTHIILITALMILNGITFASPNLSQILSDIISRTAPNAVVGMIVRDAKTGEYLYTKHAGQPFTPASNTKLFTAYTALKTLGFNYKYQTILGIKKNKRLAKIFKGNLYLHFSGDPSLTDKQLGNLIKKLQSKGVEKIQGNIIIDNTDFPKPYISAGTSYDDLGWYYAAPVSAIIINENAAPFEFKPSKTLGKPIKITSINEKHYLTIHNQAITVTQKQAKTRCRLSVFDNKNNHVKVSGCLGVRKKAYTQVLAIPNPALLATHIIQNNLKKYKINLNGKIILAKMPKKYKPIATHYSKPLSQLARYMLLISDNVYADAIEKTMGKVKGKAGSYLEGSWVMKSVLARNTNINTRQIKLRDGAGTRYNLISPLQVNQLLFAIYHQPKFKSYFQKSLPRAGVNGSLKRRLQAYPVKNTIGAKTGTMHDISALSGFLKTNSGRTLIFSIMTNHYMGPIGEVKRMEDQLLVALSENAIKNF